LFVGNLATETTRAKVHELFGSVGSVTSCQLIEDRETGRPKGFGFVEMDSAETADAAKAKFNGYELHGRPLKVDAAKPRGAR
jgi:RNA recognition motif-containing protein